MNNRYKYMLIIFLIFAAFTTYAQVWEVPEEESAKDNPNDYILENVERGKALYDINCKTCHGDPGKNNAQPLMPPPPDVASAQMQGNTEGALFYKISMGRGTMPPFEEVISEADRWNIVNFIMNYNPERTALYIELPPVKAILKASLLKEDRKVKVYAEYEEEDGTYKSLIKKPVYFYAQRTFGKLPIGEAVCDENGEVEFNLPDDIIGDENGLYDVIVGLSDDYIVDEAVLIGIQSEVSKKHTALIRRGVLWSTNDNMPWWLVISYFGVVAGVWITIGYVVLQIVKIAKLSKKE